MLYSHIFSLACNIFSNILIEHIQKLEIPVLYEFGVRFHTKAWKSNLSCFTDCTKHSSAGTLIHRQQTVHRIFTRTKLSSIYRHKPYCLQFRRISNLHNFFFIFRSRRLYRNSRKRVDCEQAPVGEEGVPRVPRPAAHSLRSRSHDGLTPTRSLAEFLSDLSGSLLAG